MKKYKLSILIPARNEEWLNETIEDLLKNKRDATQIIIGLDGQWPTKPIPNHPDVSIYFTPESIGQRAITKQCARLSRAKYIIKCDAHCAFDEGFDTKMLQAFEVAGDNTVIIPVMRNLHVFNLKCPDGHTRYQSPDGPCTQCGKPTEKDVVWISKERPESTSYCFDSEPHFQYFREYTRRPEYIEMKEKTGLTETMSIQGSFFMMTRKKYFNLDIDDDNFGSWGGQGIAVACAVWLSGGRVLVNHKTWYSHCFRTQGGSFGFPYELSGREVEKTKQNVRDKFWNKQHPKQIYPVKWLIEKFAPVKGWSQIEIDALK